MIHFKMPDGQIFGYDDKNPLDEKLIVAARAAGGTEVPQPANPVVDPAILQIAVLERTLTPRRIREAVLGTDNGYLKSVDAQIAALRATIKK